MIQVLFICLGNICRSPMAEAVMQHLIAEAGLENRIVVDSVGIGAWHVGQPAHHGTLDVLQRHGIPCVGRARQITLDDIHNADYLIAMDGENMADVRQLDSAGIAKTKLHLLLEFAPDGTRRDVPDPYYTGTFDEVYHLVDAGCRGLFAHMRATHQL